jgi:tyrosine-protein phosphatase SIW14
LIKSAILIFLLFVIFEIIPISETAAENKASGFLESSATTGTVAMLPEEAQISERIFGLPGLSDVGRVPPGIYRGSQPLPEGYITLKKMGIKTVINLRTSKSEKEIVESTGMRSIEIPMNVLSDVNVETVNRVIEITADPINQSVYIHCKLGQDRTGIVIAVYRIKVDGWTLEEAEAEMQAFGFNDLWSKLKKFIRKYAKSIGK